MAELTDIEFYTEREKHAREMAEQARDPSIAKIHLEMAEHYAGLIGGAKKLAHDGKATRPKLRIVSPGA